MRQFTRAAIPSLCTLAGLPLAAEAFPITYQGVLRSAGVPVNGSHAITVQLTDSPVGGVLLDSVSFPIVSVTEGQFTLQFEFADAHFNGADRWMTIVVDGVSLSPRQRVTYAPYAIRADTARQAGTVNVPLVLSGGTVVLESFASASGGTGVRGVHLSSSGTSAGVLGQTNSTGGNASGVIGEVVSTSPGSFSAGVRGINNSTSGSGIGVWGSQEGGGWGVYGIAPSGRGVFGSSTSGVGVRGATGTGTAVEAVNSGSGTNALLGTADHGVYATNTNIPGEGIAIEGEGGRVGVRGRAPGAGFGSDLTRIGVEGIAGDYSTGANQIYGVFGFGQAPAAGGGRNAYGVYGLAQSGVSGNTGYGVYGRAVGPGANWAAYFEGNVHVLGTLSKSSGSFKIDHPLDPENKYLSHSFVESPDMMNIYNGVAVVGEGGTVTVTLPSYFEALNTSFRYQLTAIGGAMRDLHIAGEVSGNTFTIGGGAPGGKVSWQVTGVRQDASAKYHPIVVEEEKAPAHKGLYLDPGAYGADVSKGIHTRTIGAH